MAVLISSKVAFGIGNALNDLNFACAQHAGKTLKLVTAKMSHISAKVRLRPIRFAFLVRPNDKKHVLEIFQVNSCLWGGKYNPIIPYFKQVPNWWDRHNHRLETAIQITNGYLDFFEPDFIVETEPGMADGLGFNSERVLLLSDILTREGDRDWNGYGLSVFDLYRDLYRKEFQFTRRHNHNIVNVSPEKLSFKAFSACLFGAFPTEQGLKYLGKAFEDAFGPKEILLNDQSIVDLYNSGFTSALDLGHSTIKIDYHDRNRPKLFILDAQSPKDLIDFWNLRAVKQHVIPIPVQWLEELAGFCKEFIVSNYRPLPGNPHGVMIRTNVIFARSIATEKVEQLYTDHLRVEGNGKCALQSWYPPIWRASPSFTAREMRPTLSAAENSFNTTLSDEKTEVRFDTLYPEFANEYGNKNRWANVVNLLDWTHKGQIATAFPINYRNPTFPNFRIGREQILPTSEGLVIFPRHRNTPNQWEIPAGTEAIKKWLETQGIKVVLSDAGRSTQQIIQTLGGFWGVAKLAHPDIIKLLNEISRRPITRSIHYQEFTNRITNAVKNDTWRDHNFETLVERNAVELGLELKCSKCSSWSWYKLNQLDYQMDCSLCLRPFGFPITAPRDSSHSKWAYRLIGPFALPDYANGGYAASLSIRFFSDVVAQLDQTSVTWSAGQELELAPNNKVESDFILWYQRKAIFGNDYNTDIIFGEAKSFGLDVFKVEDVERMKILAQRFPGSVLVFSTMKQAKDLSREEVARIAKLAEWGRQYIKESRQTRAPVVILTGTELFAPYSIEETWRAEGGRHAQLIENVTTRLDNVRVLADLTQQLYLNMTPYFEWFEAKMKMRETQKKNTSS